jgi:hypothetical protein
MDKQTNTPEDWRILAERDIAVADKNDSGFSATGNSRIVLTAAIDCVKRYLSLYALT